MASSDSEADVQTMVRNALAAYNGFASRLDIHNYLHCVDSTLTETAIDSAMAGLLVGGGISFTGIGAAGSIYKLVDS